MLRLREDALFTASKSKESAFSGILLGIHNENDGAKLSRKVGVIKIVTQPAVDETIVVGGITYTFKATAALATQIALGNLVTNGDFALTSGWINYGNWVLSAGKATHTAGVGYTQSLTQEWFPKVVVGYSYVTGFTIANRSAGSVQIKIGGVLGTARSTNATFAQTIIALTNGDLQFVPTADFDGEISAVTVTNTNTDLKGLTAKNIADRVNTDTVTSLCTAYLNPNATGLTAQVVLLANTIGVTPTLTVDGVKITNPIAMAVTLTEAQLENVLYWKKDITSEADCKPTVLVERNAGTYQNFLY